MILRVNPGNPGDFTFHELARKVIGLTGSRSELVFKALPSDDPTRRCPDISLAREKPDREPTVGFEDGLNKTVACLTGCLAMIFRNPRFAGVTRTFHGKPS